MSGVFVMFAGAIAAGVTIASEQWYLLPINVACMLIGLAIMVNES